MDMKRILRGRSTRSRRFLSEDDDLGVQALPATPTAPRSSGRQNSEAEPVVESTDSSMPSKSQAESEVETVVDVNKPEVSSFAPENFAFEFKVNTHFIQYIDMYMYCMYNCILFFIFYTKWCKCI